MSAQTDQSAVVIIGAGQAGFWVAKTVKDEVHRGPVILVGEEAHPPYERPPLSKEIMRGEMEPERAYFSTPDTLAASDIVWSGGVRAERIDRQERVVALSDGRTLHYDVLVLATGGRARQLPIAAEGVSVSYLRTIEDSLEIRRSLQCGKGLLVVGGGWIGLEAAASARSVGVPVTLVESAPRLCGRVLPKEAAAYLLELHQRRGVDVRLECSVEAFGPDSARLSTGEDIPFGAVVAGIGMVPNSEIARACGLDVDDGIVVDARGRTSDPAIFAVGDVARYPSQIYGRSLRLESWSNAQNQAIAVAKTILGSEAAYDPVPWFWSDQYDVNLQVLGLPGADHEVVERGDSEGGPFSLFYLRAGLVEAAISVNDALTNRIAKRLIEGRLRVDPSSLSDPSVDLRRLLRKG